MTLLTARHAGRTMTAQAGPGQVLRAALDSTDLRVRTGCNGNGSCGLCRLRIVHGRVSAPTDQERMHLGPELLEAGVRLACQTVALGEVTLEVEHLAPLPIWLDVTHDSRMDPDGSRPAIPDLRPGESFQAALDLGTTNLHLTTWDAEGTRLRDQRGPNPQAPWGSDVVTRLQAARDPAMALRLAQVIERAVREAFRGLIPAGADPRPAGSILVVGNSAMLALVQGTPGGLLDPGAWNGLAPADSRPPLTWALSNQDSAQVTLVPPLGGFVGSDLLAAVLAADLLDKEAPALLLDYGTNTEIALWDGATLWVTSAAGGPAFEASGLRCAVPAESGAIFRVGPGSPLTFRVMGGGPPMGVCGTGLVDWVACLRADGMLTRRGTFAVGASQGAMALGEEAAGIVLTKRDVDLFQRAKAAIATGIQALLGQAGLKLSDLRRVVSTGLFGRGLDVAHAQAIGLLPAVPRDRVETHGNLALAGCERMLQAHEGSQMVDRLRARARLVNLAGYAGFEDLFLQNLFLAPLEYP